MELPQETIRAKRDGHPLSAAQIEGFVRGLVDGTWSEGQAAALAMAVVLRGMSRDETVALTRAMTHSGELLSWQGLDLPGPVLDKHSTGGIGDTVSLVLAPLLAACGAVVPMISGRGLGHTGGTLDKLEALPGYRVDPPREQLLATLRGAGCAIVGASERLAPADRRLYAIRDVTATVESVPLITASILSKKLAAGLQGLAMDVKVGRGAFCTTMDEARALAESLVMVAAGAGLPTVALVTDMDEALAPAAGNALEVAEALAVLRGRGARSQRCVGPPSKRGVKHLPPARTDPRPRGRTAGAGRPGVRSGRGPADGGARADVRPRRRTLRPHGGTARRAARCPARPGYVRGAGTPPGAGLACRAARRVRRARARPRGGAARRRTGAAR